MGRKFLSGFVIIIVGKAIEGSFNFPDYSIVIALAIIVYALFKVWDINKLSSS